MEHHPLQWTAPSPTWPALTGAADPEVRRAFNRPSLLRFAADSFMDDFRSMLDVDPMRLGEFAARPETWRGALGSVAPTPAAPLFARALQRKRLAALRRTSTAVAEAATPAPATTEPQPVLKLYQPAHQRYYLVIANLVCQLPGLPDHAIQAGTEERATFVLRRLLPKAGVKRPTADPATADEYAFVAGSGGQGWRQVTSPAGGAALVPGEDQLALFHAAYRTDDDRRRKVLAGLVPVSRRDAYIGAAPLGDPPSGTATTSWPLPAPDPRFTLLQKQVTHPWRQIVARATAAENILSKARTVPEGSTAPDQNEREALRKEARQGIQISSWYVLLDFARFLQAHLPNVWAGLGGTAQAPSGAETALINAIAGTTYIRDGGTRTMGSALAAIRAREAQLEAVATPYEEGSPAWPSELFSLAIVRPTEVLAPKTGEVARSPIESFSGLTPQTLEPLVVNALPAAATAPLPAAAARLPLEPSDPGWFVIRCVYERPACGPFAPTVVSEPTEVFQLAGFFDPDAPSRPIRIGLPLDVSPAGLSKFDKNTGFMVSDVLCGMMERVKGLTLGDLVLSVLPWPFHKSLPETEQKPCPDGRMLILSIPILTICALILAIIIVAVLNILFAWIPLFIVEIVVPGLKAKRETT